MVLLRDYDWKTIGSNSMNDVSFNRPFRIGLFRTCGQLGHHVPAHASNLTIKQVFLFIYLVIQQKRGKLNSIANRLVSKADFGRVIVIVSFVRVCAFRFVMMDCGFHKRRFVMMQAARLL
jgi:hypothetical protein